MIDDVVEGFEDAVGEPISRMNCQIFSWPLSSGARGGSGISEMLLGMFSVLVPCQPA